MKKLGMVVGVVALCLIVVLAFCFGWLIWPTPYRQLGWHEGAFFRVNRLTGEVQVWGGGHRAGASGGWIGYEWDETSRATTVSDLPTVSDVLGRR